MPGTAPWDLVGAVRDGTASGVYEVEEPEVVAAQLADQPGVVVVAPHEVASALAAVHVGLAEALVDRARRAEAEVDTSSAAEADEASDDEDADADWQAVRFALLILLFALPAGLAVYAVDGTVLAAALPAAALLGLGAVVLAHRRPSRAGSVDPPPSVTTAAPPNVDRSPAVRAAEAHLRRRQAAWKLTWWERDEPVPDLGTWSSTGEDAQPVTVVVLDRHRVADEPADATTTAAGAAAVRVVVLRARA